MGKKHKIKKRKEKSVDDECQDEEGEKEPLKIVLKVGNPSPSPEPYSQSHEERRHKHKKKKKKRSAEEKKKPKSRPLEEEPSQETDDDDDVEDDDNDVEDNYSISQDDEESIEPPTKKFHLENDEESNSSMDSRVMQSRISAQKDADEKGILKGSLQYIHKKLLKKDANAFFYYPVSDEIAPGYSTLIGTPMDFSTMLSKIEEDQYDSILDYKKDFVQMCNNAMTYNRPETIFYKEAKKLLHSGMKMMSKDKLISMKRNLGFMNSITMDELGVNKPDDTGALVETIEAKDAAYQLQAKERDKIGRFEAFADNLSPGEILAQAQAAAQEARDMLTYREPAAKLSFLRRREDGSTSLTVLNTDNDGIVGDNERVVSLGSLISKPVGGTGTIAGFKEDKRNKISQVNYLNYGPFSSHAPIYDSSFANVCKEESDLLLSTYGDEAGVQYASSVMKFVEDAEGDSTRIVESLLDVLTKGEHAQSMKHIEQLRRDKENQKLLDSLKAPDSEDGENSAKTTDPAGDEIQKRLDQTAGLLTELQETQYERLSQKPPAHLSHIPTPTDKESQLAEKVTQELTGLAKDTIPQNVVSLRGIRNTMGIGVEPPASGDDESQPIEIDDIPDNQSEVEKSHGGKTNQFEHYILEDTCQSYNEDSMDTEQPEIGNL